MSSPDPEEPFETVSVDEVPVIDPENVGATTHNFDEDVKSIDFLNHGDHYETTMLGNCGRAIVADFKRTIGTYWCQEMTNFNQKTVAVSIFIFFAAVAPAITFGAVYSKVTNDAIGAVEMLIATAWCGIVYALIGGQPIVSDFRPMHVPQQ